MDFHAARDLSREINGLPPLGFDVRPQTLEAKEREQEKLEREQRALQGNKRPRGGRGGVSSSGAKRGKATSSPHKPTIANRPIDSYFLKKS